MLPLSIAMPFPLRCLLGRLSFCLLLSVVAAPVLSQPQDSTSLHFVDLAINHETGTLIGQESERFGLYRSTDLGETWEEVEFLWSPFLRTIVAGNGAILAVPNSPSWADDDGNPYPMYRSTDDGQTWQILEELVGISVQRIVTTGSAWFLMTTSGQLLRTTDAGIFFEELPLPSDSTWGPIAAVDAAPGVVLLTSSRSGALISRDDGATWQPFVPPVANCSTPLISGGLLTVACGDSLYFSETAGRSWQARRFITDEFQLLSIDTHLYLASGHDMDGTGHTYYATSISQNSDWVVVDSLLPANIGNWFWDRDVMIVRTVDSLAVSRDGGAIWNRAACALAPSSSASFALFDDSRDSALFGCINMGMVAPSGVLFGASSAQILFNSFDSGRSWDLTSFPTESYPNKWWFADSIIIVETVGNGFQNILLISHSQGTGWWDVQLPEGEMELSVANNLGVVVKMNDGTIYRKAVRDTVWKRVKLDSNVAEFTATGTTLYALMGSQLDETSGKPTEEFRMQSKDGGVTWKRLLLPNGATVQQTNSLLVWSIEGKEIGIEIEGRKKPIRKPWIPGQYGIMRGRDSLYLMGSDDPSGNQFFVTSIAGNDGWQAIDARFPKGYIAMFSVHDVILYAVIEDTPYRSEDHGATWQQLRCR